MRPVTSVLPHYWLFTIQLRNKRWSRRIFLLIWVNIVGYIHCSPKKGRKTDIELFCCSVMAFNYSQKQGCSTILSRESDPELLWTRLFDVLSQRLMNSSVWLRTCCVRSQWPCPLTTEFLSLHLWVLVDIRAKCKEIASSCSWDFIVTRIWPADSKMKQLWCVNHIKV